MLFAVLYGKEIGAGARAEALWAEHALLREEIAGLVPILRELNAVLTPPHALAPEIPLALHARYLGVELSAAFDHRTREGNFRDYYTGVELTHGKRFDLLLVTLDKAAATKEHSALPGLPPQREAVSLAVEGPNHTRVNGGTAAPRSGAVQRDTAAVRAGASG
jgi:hypothetical protein